ncbi:MAG: stage III sporulation protein AB [Eubacteriales bacterium]|nr:stage III sporulation protein AB [Eubacteriales bacterium]
MLKMAGLLFLFLGCTGAGLAVSASLGERVRLLEEMKHMLKLLAGEIRHGHASLPEAFFQTGKRCKPPFSGFLREAARMMEESSGMGLAEIVRTAGERELKASALKPDDREILLELGERLGVLDVESQLGILELSWEQAGRQADAAREAYRQKSRVARYLGVLSGLFLVVLLF